MKNIDILGYIILIGILGICLYVYFENWGEFQLKCIVSNEDGNKYCVRERSKVKQAVNLLSKITNKYICVSQGMLKESLKYNVGFKKQYQIVHSGFNIKKFKNN